MSNYATGDLFDSFLPITHCLRKSDIAFSVLIWRVFLARLVYQLRHWGCELLFRWLIPGCLRIFTQNGPPKQRGRCAPNLLLSALAPLSIWEARISFQCDYRVASLRSDSWLLPSPSWGFGLLKSRNSGTQVSISYLCSRESVIRRLKNPLPFHSLIWFRALDTIFVPCFVETACVLLNLINFWGLLRAKNCFDEFLWFWHLRLGEPLRVGCELRVSNGSLNRLC